LSRPTPTLQKEKGRGSGPFIAERAGEISALRGWALPALACFPPSFGRGTLARRLLGQLADLLGLFLRHGPNDTVAQRLVDRRANLFAASSTPW